MGSRPEDVHRAHQICVRTIELHHILRPLMTVTDTVPRFKSLVVFRYDHGIQSFDTANVSLKTMQSRSADAILTQGAL